MRKLKLAILSSNALSVTPDPATLPAGWSTSIHDLLGQLADGLVDRGHDVTLFASGDSRTKAKLEFVTAVPASVDPVFKTEHSEHLEHLLISKCFARNLEEKYDLIYSQFDIQTRFYAQFFATPVVATMHGPHSAYKEKLFPLLPSEISYVALSNYQKSQMPYVNYVEVIPNGVDLDEFPMDEFGGDIFTFVGRVVRDKGPDLLVRAVKELKLRARIVGGSWEHEFFANEVKAHESESIQVLGARPKSELPGYYRESRALVMPLRWDEAFGLVFIEAMACGTPLIAFARGAAPEIIEDGVTGFLVNPEDRKVGDYEVTETGFAGLKAALKLMAGLTRERYLEMRKRARKLVEEKFSRTKMVESYERLFIRLALQ